MEGEREGERQKKRTRKSTVSWRVREETEDLLDCGEEPEWLLVERKRKTGKLSVRGPVFRQTEAAGERADQSRGREKKAR